MRRTWGRTAQPSWAMAVLTSVGIAIATVFTVLSAPLAAAHDVVINSTPQDGSTVKEFPQKIVLEFSAIPLDTFNRVAVSNSDSGEILYQGEPELDQQLVIIDLPEGMDPGDGNYLVGFQITSSDGHATRGGTTFSVDSGEGAVAPATDASSEKSESSETDTLGSEGERLAPMIIIAGGIVLLVAIVGAILMFAKRKESQK
ncbi:MULTISPECIES: copper resistance CopC family protein [Corynebacterium]|uniref:copper resistance CopC family protein n=1 Tax=Corynebacterium TaxID=1716 RepID=UPI001CEF8712|nr:MULTISPECIES: copper resistance protein CopC [Corynebacterium]